MIPAAMIHKRMRRKLIVLVAFLSGRCRSVSTAEFDMTFNPGGAFAMWPFTRIAEDNGRPLSTIFCASCSEMNTAGVPALKRMPCVRPMILKGTPASLSVLPTPMPSDLSTTACPLPVSACPSTGTGAPTPPGTTPMRLRSLTDGTFIVACRMPTGSAFCTPGILRMADGQGVLHQVRRRERTERPVRDHPLATTERIDRAFCLVLEARVDPTDQQRDGKHEAGRRDPDEKSAQSPLEIAQTDEQHRRRVTGSARLRTSRCAARARPGTLSFRFHCSFTGRRRRGPRRRARRPIPARVRPTDRRPRWPLATTQFP